MAAGDVPSGGGGGGGGPIVGEPIPWLVATLPSADYIDLCVGATAANRVTYAALFTLWGTSFGPGDGSTTFGIPDMRKRMFVGFDTSDALVDVIGEMRGSIANWSKVVAAAQLPVTSPWSASFSGNGATTTGMNTGVSHAHGPPGGLLNYWGGVDSGGVVLADGGTFRINASGESAYTNIDHAHNFTPSGSVSMAANGGGGNALDVTPPVIVVKWIVRGR